MSAHRGPTAGEGAARAGRITRVAGPLVRFDDPGGVAMHDLVVLGEGRLPGEVVAIRDGQVTAQAYEYTGGLVPGEPAVPLGRPLSARLGPGLLGGVFDGLLRPLATAPTWLTPRPAGRDGRAGGDAPGSRWRFVPRVRPGDRLAAGQALGDLPEAGVVHQQVLVPPGAGGEVARVAPEGRYGPDDPVAEVGGTAVALTTAWPVRRPRPYRERLAEREPLHTGQRAVDLLFPVARGGTAAVPGGFGTGKTMLLQQIAKWCVADVIVHVGCGERGNEMADVLTEFAALEDPRTGGRLADRTVVLANTSNMPLMAREACVHTGITVAEHFRDQGLHVVLIADSTSRWAEALREFASRTGALPAEEGYPADLASSIAAFYERAGAVVTLGGRRGSVTVVGAVSPPGGDLAEPVTAHTERFVRCLWTLDSGLAHARHYPAISWSASFSRDAAVRPPAGDPDRPARRARIAALLADADRLADLVDLVGLTALPDGERVAVLAGRLVREGLLQQSALSPHDAYSTEEKTAALTAAVLAVVERCRELVAAGVAAEAVEATDFGPLLRARDEAAPHDTGAVGAGRDAVLAALDRLGEEPR